MHQTGSTEPYRQSRLEDFKMNSINSVILTGYLGTDPEVKESQSGYSYIHLNLATHQSRRKGAEKEWETQTHWHRVLVFGNLADRCRLQLRRGSPVAIEGSLSSMEMKNSTGQSYRQVTILANKLSFMFSKQNQDNHCTEGDQEFSASPLDLAGDPTPLS